MRQSWDDYFMELAFSASKRATCPRRSVGCVLVKDKRVISTGYNGSLPGDPHCSDVGCLIVHGSCKRTVHAEPNAIRQLSKLERAGSTLYCTDCPCPDCAELVCHSGIVEVVYGRQYKVREATLQAFDYHGIILRCLNIGE